MSATYPSGTPTTAQLRGDIVDNLATPLSASILDSDTVIPVDDTTDWPVVGLLSIGAANGSGSRELCSYTGKTANSFTGVTRNFNSRLNQAWAENDVVELLWAADHHNRIVEEIIAIATDLRTAISGDLDDGATPGLTAASLKIRLDHIVSVMAIMLGGDWKTGAAMLKLAGGTMAGNIAMGSNKLTGLAAGSGNGDSLRYEQLVGLYLLLTGGTMSGNIAMGSNKVTGLAAASGNGEALRYEQLIGAYLALAGGTMTGDIDMDGNSLLNAAISIADINGSGVWGFRNRIINGDMRIDQRNEGGAVTVNALAVFRALDRWLGVGTGSAGVFTIARSTSTPPTGFTHFLRVTVTTADASLAADDIYRIGTRIEGNTVRDFLLGSASAKTITFSFWVRSSVTGTFSGALRNGAGDRSYPFTYAISSANTWEKKTITLVGDTAGTWTTDSSSGLEISLDLGSGSDYRGTADAWVAASRFAVTGATSLISTLSATWDLTGVQLVPGSQDTEFEYRPDAIEESLCYRYFTKTFVRGTAVAQNAGNAGALNYRTPVTGTTNLSYDWRLPVRMRSAPTVVFYNPGAANAKWRNVTDGADSGDSSNITAYTTENTVAIQNSQVATDTISESLAVHCAATAEL